MFKIILGILFIFIIVMEFGDFITSPFFIFACLVVSVLVFTDIGSCGSGHTRSKSEITSAPDSQDIIVDELSYQTGADTSWRSDLVRKLESRNKISPTPSTVDIQDVWLNESIIFTGKAIDISYVNSERTRYRLIVRETLIGGSAGFDVGANLSISVICPKQLTDPVWSKIQDKTITVDDNIAVAARITEVRREEVDTGVKYIGYGSCTSLRYLPQ